MAATKVWAKALRLYVETGFGADADEKFANWCASRTPAITSPAQWATLVNTVTLPANNPGVDPRLLTALQFILNNAFRFPADPRPDEG